MPLIPNCLFCGRSNRIPGKHLSHVGKCGACKAELLAIDKPIEVGEEEFQEVIRETRAGWLSYSLRPSRLHDWAQAHASGRIPLA